MAQDGSMTATPDLLPPDHDDHDGGLSIDLGTLLGRRRALTLLGGAGLAVLAACGSNAASSSSSSDGSGTTGAASSVGETGSTSASSASAAGSSLAAIPEETSGPFPGDGSNGVNVLTESGIVRRDITSSFGSSSGVAEGVPAAVTLTVLDTANSGAPLVGAAVYLWHCDREGRYSLYSEGATEENYLRGVQETDANGQVTFTSIYPACYAGRWPHMHFEVYPSLAEATAAGSKLVTSQLALPADTSAAVYATDGYGQSTSNLAQVSLATDMVFSDGVELETPTVTGSVGDGFTITLDVGV
jgi:protocatechuate 3,4-dioxygenase beta subunit